MSRTGLALATLAWLVVVLGGGALLARHDASVEWSPELRLAGVDLIYALRRVAAESERLLLLDEMRPSPYAADLGTLRVDVDLASAPVADQLAVLQRQTGRFEFRVEPDLIYVRSELSLADVSDFDRKVLAGGKFEGDLRGLADWIRTQVPNVLLAINTKVGQPIFREVELDVQPRSSILDLLVEYSRVMNWGWRMRRAGQKLGEEVAEDRTKTTFLTSSVELWRSLDEPFRISPGRNETSTLKAIAQASQREGIPVVVLDRTPVGTTRGHLDILTGTDSAHLRFPEVIDRLAGRSDKPNLRWEWSDNVAVISGHFYDYADKGQSILREPLRGGHFRGSLGELARWINNNRINPSNHSLMGGEIQQDDPIVEFDIPEGATAREVLEDFTRSTGIGWVYVADEREYSAEAPRRIGDWSGGYLSYLTDWLAEPDWTQL